MIRKKIIDFLSKTIFLAILFSAKLPENYVEVVQLILVKLANTKASQD